MFDTSMDRKLSAEWLEKEIKECQQNPHKAVTIPAGTYIKLLTQSRAALKHQEVSKLPEAKLQASAFHFV